MKTSDSTDLSKLLIHPSYFAPISQYVQIINSNTLLFEVCDNYQKQTYRNRCFIFSSAGKQLLNIPIINEKGVKQRSSEVKIDNKYDWQKMQFRSLETAYNSSPFYEFYIDDLLPVFAKKWKYLIDLNLFTHSLIMEALEIDLPFEKTDYYSSEAKCNDNRMLVNSKSNKSYDLKPYYQLFSDRHGFIENLSILDLLFMEGPNALLYLERQNI